MLKAEEFFYWNNFEWWKWFSSLKRRPSIRVLHSRLVSPYKGFIVFHGCRPIDTKTYYADGIRLAKHSQLTEEARKIYLSINFPEITEEIFSKAVSEISGIDNHQLYVSMDDRLPLESGAYSHYLLYGSEHFQKIAVSLTKQSFQHRNYQQALKKLGVPTLFRVALPFEMIPKSQIKEFVESVRNTVWYSRKLPQPDKLDYTFTLTKPIPAYFLIDHKHPTSIPCLPCDF